MTRVVSCGRTTVVTAVMTTVMMTLMVTVLAIVTTGRFHVNFIVSVNFTVAMYRVRFAQKRVSFTVRVGRMRRRRRRTHHHPREGSMGKSSLSVQNKSFGCLGQLRRTGKFIHLSQRHHDSIGTFWCLLMPSGLLHQESTRHFHCRTVESLS